jgi:IS605 OrfB family transposase
MTKNKWLAFNIRMPEQLIPIYDFLQKELNEILSDKYYREELEKIDYLVHKGKVWMEMNKIFADRVKRWDNFIHMHNKAWYARILFENIRREVQSKHEAIIIWNELIENNMNIDEILFSNLVKKHKIYATRGTVSNIKRSGAVSKMSENTIFQLDYTASDKQIFIMDESNMCQIKVNKKDWIKYQIVLPSSLNHRLTGKIAKPRFMKRKSDGKYIGICSYQYISEKTEGENILGVDIGQVKLFSAISLNKNGNHSNEYVNSKYLTQNNFKLKKLYKEKENLRKILVQNELLGLDTNKNKKRKEHYVNISKKIENLKKEIAKNVAKEVVQVAQQEGCNKIHIENLSWMGSNGGKWNHAETHKRIEEKAITVGMKVVKVNPAYTSSEHPITGEKGIESGRNIKFEDGSTIDRDKLAAVNMAVRNKIGKKNKVNKLRNNSREIILKRRSRRKEILEKISNIKRDTEIVVFQPCVRNSEEGLGAWSCINQVQPNSSLLVKQHNKVMCYNL